jgi:beta-lactamase class A
LVLGLALVGTFQRLADSASGTVLGLSALSPQLDTYAQSQGSGLTVAVYLPRNGRYYVYDQDTTTVMASTAKVPILLTLLDDAERQRRTLTAAETQLATEMIEESNNDDAQTLYQEVTAQGVSQYLASIGIQGIQMQDLFGYSTTTPLAMVNLMEALRSGRILDSQDRAFALDLMGNIDPAQQMGIGETAPQGATYYMKDGWVIAPDNTWTTGSVGIVQDSAQIYDIAVYAQGHANEDDGWAVVNHVCGAVAAALTKS